jgi:hypothetical protein
LERAWWGTVDGVWLCPAARSVAQAASLTKPVIRVRSREVFGVARCEVCGNDYDKAFEVHAAGAAHVFDSFECAIHAMAPVCEHCGCKVVGHGIEANGRFFCCAHCAREVGVRQVADRV